MPDTKLELKQIPTGMTTKKTKANGKVKSNGNGEDAVPLSSLLRPRMIWASYRLEQYQGER